MKTFLTAIGALVLTTSLAAAQSRPLVTEDPEVIGAGQMLVEAGVDRQQGISYPASGLQGNLWRFGTFGLSVGVSSIAEIQLDGGVRNQLAITHKFAAPLSKDLLLPSPTSTHDVEDVVVGAKIRFATETTHRPAMALKFSTRLPNAGNESGLGLDTTDFHFALLMGKTVQSVRVVTNFGFGILGDPVRGDSQNDVIIYGASLARAVREGLEVVAELNGRASTRSGTPPVGTESRSVVRVGGRLTRGPVRLDGAFLLGVTERDPSWGVTAGLTWVFRAFTPPAQ